MTQPQTLNVLQIDRVTVDSGKMELRLCPAQMAEQRVPRRESITGRPECRAVKPLSTAPDSMVQLKLESDRSPGGFVAGMTMQDSTSIDHLKHLETRELDNHHTVSRFEDSRHGLLVEQHLVGTAVEGTLRSWTTVHNQGDAPVIKNGTTSYIGCTPDNWYQPTGWSGILRESDSGDQALLVIHAYDALPETDLQIELPTNAFGLPELSLHDATTSEPIFRDGTLTLPKGSAFRGYAFLFQK